MVLDKNKKDFFLPQLLQLPSDASAEEPVDFLCPHVIRKSYAQFVFHNFVFKKGSFWQIIKIEFNFTVKIRYRGMSYNFFNLLNFFQNQSK